MIFDEINDKSSRKEDVVDDDAGTLKMKQLAINEANLKEVE